MAHFVEQSGELPQNKWVLSIVQEGFRILFNLTPHLSTVLVSLSQFSLVCELILVNNWTVSIDLRDAYLHLHIHPQSRKYLRLVSGNQVFQFTALLSEYPCPWIFTKLIDVIAAHLRHCAISTFLYLDNWLIRDLIRSRLISHTIYCPQMVQSLRFIPNLKKVRFETSSAIHLYRDGISDNKIQSRVPPDCMESLLLTIKQFLSQTQVSAQTFLLFWANSVLQQT